MTSSWWFRVLGTWHNVASYSLYIALWILRPPYVATSKRLSHGIEHGQESSESETDGQHTLHFDHRKVSVCVLQPFLFSFQFLLLLWVCRLRALFLFLNWIKEQHKNLQNYVVSQSNNFSHPANKKKRNFVWLNFLK